MEENNDSILNIDNFITCGFKVNKIYVSNDKPFQTAPSTSKVFNTIGYLDVCH